MFVKRTRNVIKGLIVNLSSV